MTEPYDGRHYAECLIPEKTTVGKILNTNQTHQTLRLCMKNNAVLAITQSILWIGLYLLYIYAHNWIRTRYTPTSNKYWITYYEVYVSPHGNTSDTAYKFAFLLIILMSSWTVLSVHLLGTTKDNNNNNLTCHNKTRCTKCMYFSWGSITLLLCITDLVFTAFILRDIIRICPADGWFIPVKGVNLRNETDPYRCCNCTEYKPGCRIPENGTKEKDDINNKYNNGTKEEDDNYKNETRINQTRYFPHKVILTYVEQTLTPDKRIMLSVMVFMLLLSSRLFIFWVVNLLMAITALTTSCLKEQEETCFINTPKPEEEIELRALLPGPIQPAKPEIKPIFKPIIMCGPKPKNRLMHKPSIICETTKRIKYPFVDKLKDSTYKYINRRRLKRSLSTSELGSSRYQTQGFNNYGRYSPGSQGDYPGYNKIRRSHSFSPRCFISRENPSRSFQYHPVPSNFTPGVYPSTKNRINKSSGSFKTLTASSVTLPYNPLAKRLRKGFIKPPFDPDRVQVESRYIPRISTRKKSCLNRDLSIQSSEKDTCLVGYPVLPKRIINQCEVCRRYNSRKELKNLSLKNESDPCTRINCRNTCSCPYKFPGRKFQNNNKYTLENKMDTSTICSKDCSSFSNSRTTTICPVYQKDKGYSSTLTTTRSLPYPHPFYSTPSKFQKKVSFVNLRKKKNIYPCGRPKSILRNKKSSSSCSCCSSRRNKSRTINNKRARIIGSDSKLFAHTCNCPYRARSRKLPRIALIKPSLFKNRIDSRTSISTRRTKTPNRKASYQYLECPYRHYPRITPENAYKSSTRRILLKNPWLCSKSKTSIKSCKCPVQEYPAFTRNIRPRITPEKSSTKRILPKNPWRCSKSKTSIKSCKCPVQEYHVSTRNIRPRITPQKSSTKRILTQNPWLFSKSKTYIKSCKCPGHVSRSKSRTRRVRIAPCPYPLKYGSNPSYMRLKSGSCQTLETCNHPFSPAKSRVGTPRIKPCPLRKYGTDSTIKRTSLNPQGLPPFTSLDPYKKYSIYSPIKSRVVTSRITPVKPYKTTTKKIGSCSKVYTISRECPDEDYPVSRTITPRIALVPSFTRHKSGSFQSLDAYNCPYKEYPISPVQSRVGTPRINPVKPCKTTGSKVPIKSPDKEYPVCRPRTSRITLLKPYKTSKRILPHNPSYGSRSKVSNPGEDYPVSQTIKPRIALLTSHKTSSKRILLQNRRSSSSIKSPDQDYPVSRTTKPRMSPYKRFQFQYLRLSSGSKASIKSLDQYYPVSRNIGSRIKKIPAHRRPESRTKVSIQSYKCSNRQYKVSGPSFLESKEEIRTKEEENKPDLSLNVPDIELFDKNNSCITIYVHHESSSADEECY